MRSAYAVVRLCYDRIAYFLDKFQRAFQLVYHMVTGYRDTSLDVEFLHLGFELDTRNVLYLEPGSDMELGTQVSIALQPVFIIGFQPIDLAMLVDEEGNSAVNLIIVLQAAYAEVLIHSPL